MCIKSEKEEKRKGEEKMEGRGKGRRTNSIIVCHHGIYQISALIKVLLHFQCFTISETGMVLREAKFNMNLYYMLLSFFFCHKSKRKCCNWDNFKYNTQICQTDLNIFCRAILRNLIDYLYGSQHKTRQQSSFLLSHSVHKNEVE